MSKNVFAIPPDLYQSDLPNGFLCTLYVGRMTGKLGTVTQGGSLQQFTFEIYNEADPTEMAVRYVTYEAPAGELARWENAGDKVGVVIAHKGEVMEMVLAYNLTRRKWFATGYYPHIKDHSLASKLSVAKLREYTMLSMVGVLLCGLGVIGIIVCMFVSMQKTQTYKVLNPTDYRGATALKIANWITTNEAMFVQRTGPAADPSL